ncbi:ABC transporter substrate-binding protein, partial [Candidatus Aerophobetes bacterium]
EERGLCWERVTANLTQVCIWQMDTSSAWVSWPAGVVNFHGAYQYWQWYITGGKAGIKPTGDMARLFELWDKLQVTTDEKERECIAREMTDLHAKNIWIIGTVGEAIQPVVVKNDFRNVPEELISTNSAQTPGNAQTAQFFIKQK